MGKLFERIINNRIQTQITMTPNQVGGQKGKATVDYILRIWNIINKARKSKQTIQITFLDVTKAWNKAIMYTLDKSGIKRDEWTIAKKLNENITARIRTSNGQTRRIQIKDSIRQGGRAGKNHDFFKKVMTFFIFFYLNQLFLFKSNILINIL